MTPGGTPAGAVRLAGGRALVTGASSGIGAAVARALDARGVRVALAGRDPAALSSVASAMRDPVTVTADLTGSGEPKAVVAAALDALGGLDIVVANAGAGWSGATLDMTAADIDGLIDLNLRATIHLVHAAVGHLRAKGRGHVILIGSIAGLLPVRGEAVYSATKAGVAAFAEALRSEMAGTGVKVSLVSPGAVDTAFFARRNVGYQRTRPAPIPAVAVAAAVVDCLEHGRPQRVVPAWLTVAVRVRGAAPPLYRVLADRFG